MDNRDKYLLSGLAAAVLLALRYGEPSIYYVKSMGSYNARTIPPIGIFISEQQRGNERLIDHERVHWQQYQERGLLGYYFDYLGELYAYGYDVMPMEMQARENEPDDCKLNYTECVRSGKALTVHNPNFRM